MKLTETPDSSMIEYIAYYNRALKVKFKTGSIYEYYNVPLRIYYDLTFNVAVGSSVGKLFNSCIKGKFKSNKVA